MTHNTTPETPEPITTPDTPIGDSTDTVDEAPSAPATIYDANGQVVRREETWPRADWKPIERTMQYCNSRHVGVAMGCQLCGAPLVPGGREADGAMRVECACVVRRWVQQ